ncbi:MAG: hypothetical protein L0229_13755 [Blastocatellia bacterium]|nr:hypothetical protein [Blastocatellia bacterium]
MLIVAALILTVVVLSYFMKTGQPQLIGPRTSLVEMGVQIICGDCSGDNAMPVKTFLNRSGNCDRCGGRSYVLASELALRLLHRRPLEPTQLHSVPNKSRVLPFEGRKTGANRTRTVAV